MGDSFAPPPGPPPPKAPSVPEGWKAQFNEEYKEWFYVNLYTEKSQWEKPTEPAHSATDHLSPAGPPPSYDTTSSSSGQGQGDRKVDAKSYGDSSSQQSIESDARYAAQLQAEEDARAAASHTPLGSQQRGPDGYGGSPAYDNASYDAIPLPPRPRDGNKPSGLLERLVSKVQSSSPRRTGPQGSYPQAGYGQNNYNQPAYGQPMYGYPPQGSGYTPGPYAQQPAPYAQQPAPYAQPPPRRHGGLGAGGAAALGAGGGLLGGVLLAEAFNHHEENQAYDQGYEQGTDNADAGYGGDGDFGGDFGGGDF